MRRPVVNVVILLLVGAVLAVGALVLQSQRKDSLGQSMLREFKDDLARMPMDAPARAYVEGLADAFHDEAYGRSFGANAPALGGTTDVTSYQRSLLSSMIGQAERDRRAGIVKALNDFRDTFATLELHEDGGGG